MCLAGTGATFVLSDGVVGAIGDIISMGSWVEDVADIEDNDLGTIGHAQYCPGTLINHSELELAIRFDPDKFAEGPLSAALGTTATGTLTFPVPAGMDAGATLAGSGYIRSRGFDGLENNERIEGSYIWRFDGKTAVGPPAQVPPAYTASSSTP